SSRRRLLRAAGRGVVGRQGQQAEGQDGGGQTRAPRGTRTAVVHDATHTYRLGKRGTSAVRDRPGSGARGRGRGVLVQEAWRRSGKQWRSPHLRGACAESGVWLSPLAPENGGEGGRRGIHSGIYSRTPPQGAGPRGRQRRGRGGAGWPGDVLDAVREGAVASG